MYLSVKKSLNDKYGIRLAGLFIDFLNSGQSDQHSWNTLLALAYL